MITNSPFKSIAISKVHMIDNLIQVTRSMPKINNMLSRFPHPPNDCLFRLKVKSGVTLKLKF